MIRPNECDEQGRLLCPEGYLSEYLSFDYETQMINYGGNQEKCQLCIRNIFRLIVGMQKHCHEKYVSKERTARLRQMAEKEMYGYSNTIQARKVA